MKFLLSIFALVMITGSCSSSKAAKTSAKEKPAVASKPSKQNSTDKSDIVKGYSDTVIKYEASSRGNISYISISESKVSISNDINLKNIETYKCDAKDWTELNQLLKAIDVLKLNKLKAPTNMRLYDGAAHTTLSVQLGDMIVMTPSFDEGHPPKDIEAIVNKILSIKESVTKD